MREKRKLYWTRNSSDTKKERKREPYPTENSSDSEKEVKGAVLLEKKQSFHSFLGNNSVIN
ncbi:hypothetical protein AZF04_10455 [Alkalihalobacillus trypoxylicola]|uniref:Uncharacterized protein n=1 Tax=Alkalihalobacillus trypoxylicola TaxID=519424 RepID=A0A162D0L6_9BACI|nr:hypothetical protein AZF04_10455 [Alkalihalobacillus trypoxylicola]